MHERKAREKAGHGIEEEDCFGSGWGDEMGGIRGEDEGGSEGVGKDPEDGKEQVKDEEDEAVEGGDLRRHACRRGPNAVRVRSD